MINPEDNGFKQNRRDRVKFWIIICSNFGPDEMWEYTTLMKDHDNEAFGKGVN